MRAASGCKARESGCNWWWYRVSELCNCSAVPVRTICAQKRYGEDLSAVHVQLGLTKQVGASAAVLMPCCFVCGLCCQRVRCPTCPQMLGQYLSAAEFFSKSVSQLEAEFGARHPKTITALWHLSNIFIITGRPATALDLLMRCMDAYTEVKVCLLTPIASVSCGHQGRLLHPGCCCCCCCCCC